MLPEPQRALLLQQMMAAAHVLAEATPDPRRVQSAVHLLSTRMVWFDAPSASSEEARILFGGVDALRHLRLLAWDASRRVIENTDGRRVAWARVLREALQALRESVALAN